MSSDWMRDGLQNDAPFTPPEPGKLGIVLSFAVAIAVLVAFYAGYGWWDARRASEESQRESPQPQRVQLPTASGIVARPSSVPASKSGDVAPVAPPKRVSEGMHKCVVQDRVLYSDEPCPAGASASILAHAPAPSHPSTVTLYLCKATDRGLFWTRQHCHQRHALIERTATVPADRSFDEQVAWARARRVAPTAPQPSPPVAKLEGRGAAPDRTLLCKALNDRVAWLDAYARQPLSAWQQDWARSERKAARDEQFRLRC